MVAAWHLQFLKLAVYVTSPLSPCYNSNDSKNTVLLNFAHFTLTKCLQKFSLLQWNTINS